MVTEKNFKRALLIVKSYRDQVNTAYYESISGIKKDQQCTVWARNHPNMSERLRSILMYNVADKKVSEINNKNRKYIRGLGPKSWIEFCYLTNKNFI